MFKVIRPHQWTKNFLVFVPLIMSHKVSNTESLKNAILCFIAFCLCAASGYVLNDILDRKKDREHPIKKNRPFAAKTLPLSLGWFLFPVLLFSSLFIAYLSSTLLMGILIFYFFSVFSYSIFFKKIIFLDVVTLSTLYTLRIFAGAIAVAVPVSSWLLEFSMFIFLSLALAKRFSELKAASSDKEVADAGRGYLKSDLEQLARFGTTSGYMSTLILVLYASSEEVVNMHRHPKILWLLGPLVLIWISRIWIKAERGQLPGDPVSFAVRDMISYGVGVIAALVVAFAV